MRIARGRWDPPSSFAEREDLVGWVILDGMLCREVRLCDRFLLELLGGGDVVVPTTVADGPPLGGPVRLTAATDTRLMLLGPSFVRAAARWPGLFTLITQRLEAQRQRLAIQSLIVHLPRAEHRLLLQMWHLADRWGRVTPDGIVLELPLTHDVLGHLAAARRSTATLALSALEDGGVIRRLGDGSWLLTPAAEAQVAVLSKTLMTSRLLGETVKRRKAASDVLEESPVLRAQPEQLHARVRERASARPSPA